MLDNDSSDDERDAKRPRTASPKPTEEDEAAKKLYASKILVF